MVRVEWSITPADAVEGVVGVMLCRENPDATRIKPSRGDGGIDVLVPVTGRPRTIEVYQVKSFTGRGETTLTNSQKAQIRKSLERLRTFTAERSIEVTDWYLTLPLVSTNETREWFETLTSGQPFRCHWRGLDYLDGLAARYPDVIDYYLHAGRERLNTAVTSMGEALRLAQRAARRPTEPGEHTIEPAPIEPAETVEGLSGLHDLLNRDDPHYRYDLAVTTHPPQIDRAEHLLVAAVQYGTAENVVTIKVFAHYREAVFDRPIPGSFSIDPTGNEGLRRDLELFHRYGRPFDAPTGTFTAEMDLPGGLGGQMERAAASIFPAASATPGHQIYIAVLDPDGALLAEPLIDMQPATRGVSGVCSYGEDHGGSFGIEMRTDLTTGQSNIEIRSHELAGRRPRQLVEGLRFVTEFHHPNQFRMRAAYGPKQSPPAPIPDSVSLDPGALVLRSVIEGLATIQDYTTEQILVPDLTQMTTRHRMSVLDAARLLHGEVITVNWSDLGLVHLNPGIEVNAEDRFAVRLYDSITVELPDRTLTLTGYRQADIPAARPDPASIREHGDYRDVRFVPAGSNLAQFRYVSDTGAPEVGNQ